MASGIATWSLRSPVRSEWREMSTRPDDRHRVGDRGHEALADVAEAADLVDDLADPERQPVDVDDHAEVQKAEREHAAVLERIADRVALALQARRLLALQALGQPALLVAAQPAAPRRPVVEVAPHEDAAEHGGDRLDQEQPLPVLQPGDAVEDRHDRARERRADGVGDRDGRHEEADGAGALARREPVGEVEDHARGRSRPRPCRAGSARRRSPAARSRTACRPRRSPR